jgi:hypothetical protein
LSAYGNLLLGHVQSRYREDEQKMNPAAPAFGSG